MFSLVFSVDGSTNHIYLVLVELLAGSIVQLHKFIALHFEFSKKLVVLVTFQLVGQLNLFLVRGTDFVGHPWLVDLVAVLNATAILQDAAAFLDWNTLLAIGLLDIAIRTVAANGFVYCAANTFNWFAAQLPPAVLDVITSAKTLVLVVLAAVAVAIAIVISIELAVIAVHVTVVTVHHLALDWLVEACIFFFLIRMGNWLAHGASSVKMFNKKISKDDQKKTENCSIGVTCCRCFIQRNGRHFGIVIV